MVVLQPHASAGGLLHTELQVGGRDAFSHSVWHSDGAWKAKPWLAQRRGACCLSNEARIMSICLFAGSFGRLRHRQTSKRIPRRVSSISKSRPKQEIQGSQSLQQQPSVCVIGGGPAGLACAGTLRRGGAAVTLIQESRGVGGKLCTKFAGPGGKDDPSLHFDMGVQLFSLSPSLAEALGEAVAPWPEKGRLVRLVNEKVESRLPTDGLVVGVPSMSAVGQQLLEWSSGEAEAGDASGRARSMEVHLDRTAWVAGPALIGTGRWHVRWGRRVGNTGQIRTRPELADDIEEQGRDFDAVVHAYEANKILKGCRSGYKAILPSATPIINKVAKSVRTDQMWNLMLAFERPIPDRLTWDAAIINAHPALAWLANDSSKPQRSRAPECWMAMSTRQWANQRKWSQAEAARELTKHVRDLLEKAVGRKLPRIVYSKAGRWGNSTVSCTNGATSKHIEFPQMSLSTPSRSPSPVWQPGDAMGACGDWCAGFGVADAFSAGEELASLILQDSGCQPLKLASKLSRPTSSRAMISEGNRRRPRRPAAAVAVSDGQNSMTRDTRKKSASIIIRTRNASPIPLRRHGLLSPSELDLLFKKMTRSIRWVQYNTKRSRRKVFGWPIVPGSDLCPLPALRPVLDGMIRVAAKDAGQDVGQIRPIQCFLCLYEDSRNTCPVHSHDWRQVTLSLGAARNMIVDDKKLLLEHGDIIVLGGETHGIEIGRDRSVGPRISVNLFYHADGDVCTHD